MLNMMVLQACALCLQLTAMEVLELITGLECILCHSNSIHLPGKRSKMRPCAFAEELEEGIILGTSQRRHGSKNQLIVRHLSVSC